MSVISVELWSLCFTSSRKFKRRCLISYVGGLVCLVPSAVMRPEVVMPAFAVGLSNLNPHLHVIPGPQSRLLHCQAIACDLWLPSEEGGVHERGRMSWRGHRGPAGSTGGEGQPRACLSQHELPGANTIVPWFVELQLQPYHHLGSAAEALPQ